LIDLRFRTWMLDR